MSIDWTFLDSYIEALGLDTSDISIDDIRNRILEEVKQRRPIYKWAKITTVDGQGAYDIPTTDLDGNELEEARVYEVFWRVRDLDATPSLPVDGVSEVWDIINNAKLLSMAESLDSSGWEIIDGKIYLYPTPTESVDVAVLMAKTKTDDDIDEDDKLTVMHGILWILYERLCISVSGGGSFRAGSYAATVSPSAVSHLRERSEYHREQYNMLINEQDAIIVS